MGRSYLFYMTPDGRWHSSSREERCYIDRKGGSSGFTYIAVQGKDSICVATGDEKMVDTTKFRLWMGLVIIDIRGHPLFGSCRRENKLFKEDEELRPIAAVCVVLNKKKVNGESGDEASSTRLNEEEAIDIIMKKMEQNSAFTYKETVQVLVVRKGDRVGKQLPIKKIKKHLAVINQPRCEPKRGQSSTSQSREHKRPWR